MEGQRARRRAYSIPEYYNYADVEKFEKEALGIHEKIEGCTTTTTSPRSSRCTIRTGSACRSA